MPQLQSNWSILYSIFDFVLYLCQFITDICAQDRLRKTEMSTLKREECSAQVNTLFQLLIHYLGPFKSLQSNQSKLLINIVDS